MNDIELAKAEIKDHTEHNLKTKISDETSAIVVQALEKQVPMEVDYSEKNHSNLPISKCPNCGSKKINHNQLCNNCHNCGQKLDWSVENE